MTDTQSKTNEETQRLEVSIASIHCDVGHLHELLSATCEQFDDLDFGSGPTRNNTLDRIAAFLWIARDVVEKIGNDVGAAEIRYRSLEFELARLRRHNLAAQ
jgi:hypothetical protein